MSQKMYKAKITLPQREGVPLRSLSRQTTYFREGK